ncbi:MAG TPA: family 16 glycoside hydrolase, partial [Longimicrobiaceae bacterium]
MWSFDPSRHAEDGRVFRGRSRGVTYGEGREGREGRRIFHFVRDRLYALDARSGELITGFGTGGFIDLRQHLGMDPERASIEVTSPGIVYRDYLIVGSRVPEEQNSTPGHVRAFNAVTGEFEWIFHTIPKPGEFGYDTWEWVEGNTYGGANPWGGFSLDEERGLVFFATGSPTPDFYGGDRKGMNLFGNSVLALDAATGERKWHFQTVHHDLWDYDNPAAPVLVTIGSGREARDAVVQLTKMGYTFVLDRETGEPLFPVEEVPVPPSDVPGEEAWPTQPVPLKPAPLVRQSLTEADLTGITPEARASALEQFRRYRSGAIYTPPSLQGTITTPGHLGGVEWHGASYDRSMGVLYVNANDGPTLNRLRVIHRRKGELPTSPAALGLRVFEESCASCHGSDLNGDPPLYPALRNTTLTEEAIREVVHDGRNSMPSFQHLSAAEIEAVAAYLKRGAADEANGEGARAEEAGELYPVYTFESYTLFKDPEGIPAIAPPWGTLNALDLETGEIRWRVPLGEYPELAARGIRNTGTMNYGGAVATAGGLVFVAATADEKIRGFEKHSGRLLWEHPLPAGGYATPSVYMIDGRQYVVIAAGGGGKNGTRSSDAIVAFALLDGEDGPRFSGTAAADTGWIDLFDGATLDGWAHLNGWHTYTVEDGAIVGRTAVGSPNSFLATTRTFGDFELEMEVWVDSVTNSGVQFRSQSRTLGGRVNGPQMELRRYQGPGVPTTGVFYGEAMDTGWLSSQEVIDRGHRHF